MTLLVVKTSDLYASRMYVCMHAVSYCPDDQECVYVHEV